MITKVEGNNYDELFRSAEKQLGLPTNSITTIHDYLNSIKDINIRQNSNNYNLLRLPVAEDEPLFEINANTREITVPPIFKQNGLTVQGDKLAEIVYFKMARFFDMMDLYLFANDGVTSTNIHNGAHTYIEWYNPSAKNPDYQKGVDFAYAMTCDDDYIYFGWPLADKVSGESGNIQFSVRFLNITGNKIIYNYATKIASCEIKSTLNFNLSDNSIESQSWEDILYTRPVYSSVINSTESPAAILLKGIESGIMDMNKSYRTHMEVDPSTGDEHSVVEDYWSLPIDVVATTSNAVAEGVTQTLTFKWYHNSAEVIDLSKIEETAAEASYEDPKARKSTLTADEIGTYTVWIGNKISDKKNVRYIYTGTVTIPGPEDVIIDSTNIAPKGYVGTSASTLKADIKNPEAASTLLYTWYNADTDEIVQDNAEHNSPIFVATDEGRYYCIVQNTRNGVTTDINNGNISSIADIRALPQRLYTLTLSYQESNASLVATATHKYSGHRIEYIWYHYVSENGVGTYQPVFTELSDEESSYAPSLPGLYVVEAREIVFHEETGALYRRANDGMRSRSAEIEIGEDLRPVTE